MGSRGPRPTPEAILKRRGTNRGGGKSRPRPEPTQPDCPLWLDDVAKACWCEIAPQLHAAGVLTRIDGNALTRYCRIWSRWKAAEIVLDREGSTYELKDSVGELRCIMQRPEVAIAHKLAMVLTRLEAEFGMTPSARTRISVTPPVAEVDEKDKFFGCVG